MQAEGTIYRTTHLNTNYYYKPTTKVWVKNIKQISVGDIYFQGITIKLFMGENPNNPEQDDFPELPCEKWERVNFTIQTNII